MLWTQRALGAFSSWAWGLVMVLSGCSDGGPLAGPQASDEQADEPITLNEVVDPYTSCEEPSGPCTLNAIYGCTEPGARFADHGDCDAVKTQRPSPRAPTQGVRQVEHDPARLDDPDFAWVKSEIEACGCICCHSKEEGGPASNTWDIDFAPAWTESASDRGIGILAGVVSSSGLGFVPPAENNGFDRQTTGAPSTDPARMRAFFVRELERRGADLRNVRVAGSSEYVDAGLYGQGAPDGGAGQGSRD